MTFPTRSSGSFRYLAALLGAQFGSTSVAAFLTAKATQSYRVWVLALIWIFEWASVQMFADSLFDHRTGYGYEVMVFA